MFFNNLIMKFVFNYLEEIENNINKEYSELKKDNKFHRFSKKGDGKSRLHYISQLRYHIWEVRMYIKNQIKK